MSSPLGEKEVLGSGSFEKGFFKTIIPVAKSGEDLKDWLAVSTPRLNTCLDQVLLDSTQAFLQMGLF